jgi:hypothetical protein
MLSISTEREYTSHTAMLVSNDSLEGGTPIVPVSSVQDIAKAMDTATTIEPNRLRIFDLFTSLSLK